MFYSVRTCRDVPSESGSRLHPTTPFSDSAHNSQFPQRQISRPPSPAPLPAVRLPRQCYLSHLCLCNRSPLFLPRCPPIAQPRLAVFHYPRPALRAPPHSFHEELSVHPNNQQ